MHRVDNSRSMSTKSIKTAVMVALTKKSLISRACLDLTATIPTVILKPPKRRFPSIWKWVTLHAWMILQRFKKKVYLT